MKKVQPNPGSSWLNVGGWLSLAAALIHVGAILGGPDWYRFFGAGEQIATMAENGSWTPALLTSAIALVLTIWSLFAFSGSGHFMRLPLLRTALVAISAVYLLRGLIWFPMFFLSDHDLTPFDHWSSMIVLVYGVTYTVGTYKAWRAMS